MGSRLGTHIYWTLALSAAITLLALSPLVLPGAKPVEHLPPALAGIAKVGKVISSAFDQDPGPRVSEAGGAAPTSPPASSEAASPAASAFGVLSEQANGSRPTPTSEPRPGKPAGLGGGEGKPRAPGELTKAERRAERKAEKAERKAERKEEKAERKAERKEEKAKRKAERAERKAERKEEKAKRKAERKKERAERKEEKAKRKEEKAGEKGESPTAEEPAPKPKPPKAKKGKRKKGPPVGSGGHGGKPPKAHGKKGKGKS